MSSYPPLAKPPPANAGGRPYVPAGELLALVEQRFPGETIATLLNRIELPSRVAWSVASGERGWFSFQTAERIIVGLLGDPGLWHSEPFLAAVYEAGD